MYNARSGNRFALTPRHFQCSRIFGQAVMLKFLQSSNKNITFLVMSDLDFSIKCFSGLNLEQKYSWVLFDVFQKLSII